MLGAEMTLLCYYHDAEMRNVAKRRETLSTVGGGAVGLVEVPEVRISVATPRAVRVLGQPAVQRWRLRAGPDLVVDPTVGQGTVRMTWRVKDLASASRALDAVHMATVPHLVRVPMLSDLEIALVEA